jgi:hypothetical protein
MRKKVTPSTISTLQNILRKFNTVSWLRSQQCTQLVIKSLYSSTPPAPLIIIIIIIIIFFYLLPLTLPFLVLPLPVPVLPPPLLLLFIFVYSHFLYLLPGYLRISWMSRGTDLLEYKFLVMETNWTTIMAETLRIFPPINGEFHSDYSRSIRAG